MTSIALLSQKSVPVDLQWDEGDPVNLELTVADLDWATDRTYTATVGEVAMTVVATLDSGDTKFTFTIADSTTLTAGQWPFVCSDDTGKTVFRGTAFVV